MFPNIYFSFSIWIFILKGMGNQNLDLRWGIKAGIRDLNIFIAGLHFKRHPKHAKLIFLLQKINR